MHYQEHEISNFGSLRKSYADFYEFGVTMVSDQLPLPSLRPNNNYLTSPTPFHLHNIVIFY